MIKPEERFFSEGQCYFGRHDDPTAPAFCNIWDWDQLRMIKLNGTVKIFPPEEDLEVPILARFADLLSPQVCAVTLDDDGLICEISTDPDEDDTLFLAHIPFSAVESLHDCRTIQYSKLRELDRLGPGVDLSSYDDDDSQTVQVAFKFCPVWKPRSRLMAWDELQVYKNLPPHPNIVSFDRIVLDDVESRILGFTTKYIPGGTLDNPQRPFRFEYLQQLTSLIDFLNLDLGVMHQDVAPRNLLIDPETQKLLLFDFNWVAHGKESLLEGRDDVTGVAMTLYEIITGDQQFVRVPHWDRNIDMVQSIAEWPRRRELDAEVSVFREFLNEWVAKRSASNDMERYLNAPNRLDWPDQPTPPDYAIPYKRDAIANGQYVFRWERPPQSRLKAASNTA
ncbi:hypothetical protein F4802DRAFT_580738 [Xylaria palmicola]|nr:hypothetical protein F4802DRAFT_580738 [Xylaria palmicola]